MKKALSLIWHYWKKIGVAIGNFISMVVLTIFYFSIFSLYAILFKIFSGMLKSKSATSNFVIKEKTPSALKDFISE